MKRWLGRLKAAPTKAAPATAVALLAIASLGAQAPAPAIPPQPASAFVEPGVLPKSWMTGGPKCMEQPSFQVHEYNPNFFILRQSGCIHYEKPFLYLIFGRKHALLLDSGAGNVDVVTPVDTLIRAWARANGVADITLIVAHSHGHGDHVAGDSLLRLRPGTIVVGRDTTSVRTFFGIRNWPADTATFDLGGRVLDILPIPGHQAASIAVYDRRTGILLTGDTFYPGRLYVRDTADFARSIERLAQFSRSHPVSHLLGAHVEQTTTPFMDYPMGTKDQPEEHGLDLTRAQLLELDSAVRAMRGRFTRTALRDLTIWPMP